mmetsp:Transcript_14662/g.55465  ORF Transcript_14662/g.55465 Transcript_14662/m.55465 type:complete len:211 (+) Transcript_14662:3976-4608(+)
MLLISSSMQISWVSPAILRRLKKSETDVVFSSPSMSALCTSKADLEESKLPFAPAIGPLLMRSTRDLVVLATSALTVFCLVCSRLQTRFATLNISLKIQFIRLLIPSGPTSSRPFPLLRSAAVSRSSACGRLLNISAREERSFFFATVMSSRIRSAAVPFRPALTRVRLSFSAASAFTSALTVGLVGVSGMGEPSARLSHALTRTSQWKA